MNGWVTMTYLHIATKTAAVGAIGDLIAVKGPRQFVSILADLIGGWQTILFCFPTWAVRQTPRGAGRIGLPSFVHTLIHKMSTFTRSTGTQLPFRVDCSISLIEFNDIELLLTEFERVER